MFDVSSVQPDHPLATNKLREKARAQLREFLRCIPREQPDETVQIETRRGHIRTITRAEMSEGIDHLPLRQRRLVQLAFESRVKREDVCAQIGGVSIKTYEREEREALETLLGYEE